MELEVYEVIDKTFIRMDTCPLLKMWGESDGPFGDDLERAGFSEMRSIGHSATTALIVYRKDRDVFLDTGKPLATNKYKFLVQVSTPHCIAMDVWVDSALSLLEVMNKTNGFVSAFVLQDQFELIEERLECPTPKSRPSKRIR